MRKDIDAKIEFTSLNKANSLLQMEKYDDAIENFRRVLEVNPKNVDALMNKELIHYISSDIIFNKILRIMPYSAQFFSLGGSYKIKKGNIKSSIKDLASAIT
jgi:tetratricopeptide (TPR) repeat protein